MIHGYKLFERKLLKGKESPEKESHRERERERERRYKIRNVSL